MEDHILQELFMVQDLQPRLEMLLVILQNLKQIIISMELKVLLAETLIIQNLVIRRMMIIYIM